MKTIFVVAIAALFFTPSMLPATLTTVVSTPLGKKVTVGKAVPANQQVSIDTIDHSTWNQLLKKHVDESGQVNYNAWGNSTADVQSLDQYLNTLSTASTTIKASRNAQIAFWINAYNAVTIKGILREYPTTSIRNHTAKLLGYNIWKDLLLIVGETKISLEDIEHKVLRKAGEPRIHFAIVCASHSCPRLLNRAYTSDQLEQQLADNTKVFFANPENFQFNSAKRQFQMSSILVWFEEDFGTSQAARLKTIAPYLPTQESQSAAQSNAVSIAYLDYDWSLNEQRTNRR